MTTKRARWKLFHKFRTLELKVKYNNAAKKCSQEIKKFTIEKENRLCDNENLGALYKYVNKKLNGSNGIAPLKDKNGSLPWCQMTVVKQNCLMTIFVAYLPKIMALLTKNGSYQQVILL